jgi:SOS-response transcriptional repressor LexA
MYEVLTAIAAFQKSRKVSPTLKELTYMTSLNSTSAVQVTLNELFAAGYISRAAKRCPIKVLRSVPKSYDAAKAAERRKGKTEDEKKQSEAVRMRELRAAKEEHRKREEDRLNAAVALGKRNDKMDAFLIRGAFFKNRRVTGFKVG